MPLPEPLLSRLGVPVRRSLSDLARVMGASLAQLSRGDPGVARVAGYAADLLDGTATGTAELTDPVAWARALELARRIGEEDGEPAWSVEALAERLGPWGLEVRADAARGFSEALVELGAEDWHRRGGWVEVRRRAEGVLR